MSFNVFRERDVRFVATARRALWASLALIAIAPPVCADASFEAQFPPPASVSAASAPLPESVLADQTFAFVGEEHAKLIDQGRNIASLGVDLFGDQTNIQTGTTEFIHTDIDLPGNDVLPVQLIRRFSVSAKRSEPGIRQGAFADWELEAPYLSGEFASSTGWQVASPGGFTNQRCSVTASTGTVPPFVSASEGTAPYTFAPHEYWHGYQLKLPGGGGGELLWLSPTSTIPKPSDGAAYYWTTNNRWFFSCANTGAPGGETFIARTPEGLRYFFTHSVNRNTSKLGANGVDARLFRTAVRLMATRIEDRFGNFVTYTYAGNRLTAITASDGRSITLSYNANGHITSATDGTRTWSYAYTGNGTVASRHSLSVVTRPDASTWSINFAALADAYLFNERKVSNCYGAGEPFPINFSGSMTHPSGAVGTFTVSPTQHGRTEVPRVCINEGDPGGNVSDDYSWYTLSYDVLSLKQKRITDPTLPVQQWDYTYAPNFCFAGECNAQSVDYSETTVVYSGVGVDRYRFGTRYQGNEGKLLKVEHGSSLSGNTLLGVIQSEDSVYRLSDVGQPYPTPIGLSPQYRGDAFTSERYLPLERKTLNQDGISFQWLANTFDVYANPLNITRSSNLGFSKSETTVYEQFTGHWVVGQMKSLQDQSTGALEQENTFISPLGQLDETKRFTQKQLKRSYRADGTIQTIQDGKLNTTTLSNYERGVPKNILYASGALQTAVVTPIGTIQSITDAMGFSSTFQYDLIGRLQQINFPLADSTAWNAINLVFEKRTATDYGISGTHWRQLQTTGNALKETYFDALWRPILTCARDSAAPSNNRCTRTVYNTQGQVSFQSYPGILVSSATNYSTLTTGINTQYDLLGRPTQVIADSELGPLATTTEYLTGFKTRVTNPRNQITTTEYLSWDQPSTELPMRIESPEGIVTTFTRDVFGKPTAITRSGTYLGNPISVTRRYVYDDKQRLCKTIEPESGATIVEYDAADNILWRTQGSALTSLTCDRASVPISDRSQYSYDAMNRVIAIDHPNGTDDIGYTYFDDGALKTATTQGSTWTYAYNKRRLPTQESLAFDSQTFNLNWGYDGNGTANNLTYPSGLSVPFNPNALGEPQQIGSFASAIGYHPNGALAGFTYGNNVLHTTTQNARQLPLRSRAQFNGTSVVDYTLTFDQNANPTLMSDGVAGAIETKSMAYDGLDRLIGANSTGTFGNAIIEYDPLDNIRRYAVNGRDWRYVIDNTKQQLTRINNPSGVQQVAYTYDPRGNMTSRNDDGLTLTFNFDRAQRLLDNRYLSQVQQSYRYDAHGRRTESAQPNGDKRYQIYSRSGQFLYEALRPAGSPGQTRTTDYLYLGGTLIAKRVIEDIVVVPVLFKDGFETATAPVAPGPDPDALTPSALTTTITYLHTDPLGSPVAETNTLGAVIKRNRFEPFGYPLNTPTEGQPSYTGHQYDSFTDLIQAQQRYYDPRNGRFISIDPMEGNSNRYWYGNNSPYKNIDPDGRQALDHSSRYAPPLTPTAAATIVGLGADFTPIVGDIKGIVEAYNDPTIANTIGAVVSLVPVVGDVVGKIIKNAGKIADAVKSADNVADAAKTGSIYRVPGDATTSGKPYIGRHNKPKPAETRRSNDGRDRSQAEVVDTYDPAKPMEGRLKEQEHIDAEGLGNLDNKRNEIKKE